MAKAKPELAYETLSEDGKWLLYHGNHGYVHCALCRVNMVREDKYEYCDSCNTLMKLLKPLGKWIEKAKCGFGDDNFFPEKGNSAAIQTRAAKAICAECPVRQECLETALENNEIHGVWGGTGPGERRRIRHERGMVRPKSDAA